MKFWAVLALAAWAAAVPLEDASLHKRDGTMKHLGFRKVNQSEADKVKAKGGTAIESNKRGARQLGEGIYISPGFQEFPENYINPETGEEEIQWDCVVRVDQGTWDSYLKAWIPELYDVNEQMPENPNRAYCKLHRLWTMRKEWKENRIAFLTRLNSESTPANTVLFSKVGSYPHLIQALIPQEIIATGSIKLGPCAERNTPENARIPEQYKTVEWDVEHMKGWAIAGGRDYA